MEPRQEASVSEAHLKLLAYLDGELSQEQAEEVQAWLARDPEARRELELYARAMGALDYLPQLRASAHLASATVTRALGVAENVSALGRWGQALVWLGWSSGVVGLLAALLVAGWLTGEVFFLRPEEKLEELLPVLEDLDAYRAVPRPEYLRELDRLGLFQNGPPAPGTGPSPVTPISPKGPTSPSTITR